ncbi:RRXRR domain-containing protein [Streptomyces sp. CA-135486]|uniref:RRXRR domain-containing protein n=1 Tax=Streptomyces sp. CA-135486 TaxID=3240049 RepID=UPI003D91F698
MAHSAKGDHSLPLPPSVEASRVNSPSHPDQLIKGRCPSMTTFPAGEQTHQAVLPQQPALESVGADNPGSRDETAHGQPATARGTGREHGRGETGGRSTRPRRRHAAQAETGDGDVPTHSNTYKGGAGASRAFVLANDGRPLMPCHPARARELLTKGRAVVARQAPFTIRLKDRSRADSEVEGVQLRIDPGSKGTGITITDTKKEAAQDGRTVTKNRLSRFPRGA